MSYLVYSRKYRPQKLKDLVGQPHIVTMLESAVKNERLGQNFLFVGSRGVGKTSTARILAKIMNCPNRKSGDTDPCDRCDSCVEITEGRSFDVLEIDGASNRGIDEIRNLRENVKFRPASGKYKVYIIDEVHMLTTEAFNALLKTLEEPPEHVKFIFATTEIHKVIPTIISRCQRFDFRKIPVAEIVDTLSFIADREKIKIDKDALYLIAKTADGSLRDAEGILDKVSSVSEGGLSVDYVSSMLGVTPFETYFSLFGFIASGDVAGGLSVMREAVESGKDVKEFVKGLLAFSRDILVAANLEDPSGIVDAYGENVGKLKKLADKFSLNRLFYFDALLQKLNLQIKFSPLPLVSVEVAVIKMAKWDGMVNVDDVKVGATEPAGGVRSLRRAGNAGIEKKNESEVNDIAFSGGGDIFSRRVWEEFKRRISAENSIISSFFNWIRPIESKGGKVVLGIEESYSFYKDNLEKEGFTESVERILSDLLNEKVKIEYIIIGKGALGEDIEIESKDKHMADIIDAAVSIFNAKVVRGGK